MENVAIVKAYKNIKDINKALKETGFDKKAIAVSKCGRKDEQIIHNILMSLKQKNLITEH